MTIINNTPDGDETNEIKIEPVTKVTDPKVTKRYPKDIATRENIKHIFEKLSREQIIQLIFFLMFIFNINDSDLPNHQSP
jgi:hypothetical protein